METSMARLLLAIIAVWGIQCGKGEDRATDAQAGGFGLFLTRGEVPPERLVAMSHLEPADEPLLTADDIVAYDRESHSFVLTASGKSRLDTLQVPVTGRSFVVCVDRQPVYAGAFWTAISSISFDGPVIVLPVLTHTVEIQLGYPVGTACSCRDPRSHPEVMAALAAAGKLR